MKIEFIHIQIVIIGLIIWYCIGYLVWKYIKYKTIKWERKDATLRSRSVILWEVYEKILPFLPDFKYNPKDMVFIWKWIDYIIFDWLSAWQLKKVVFLEVKSGKSSLNNNERMIRDSVSKKRINYEIYRV